MDPDLKTKVDAVISKWDQGFAALQVKQQKGEPVTETDVRNVVMEAGDAIYNSGLRPDYVATSGHRSAEFQKIYDTVTDRKLDIAVAGSDGRNTVITANALQAAAIKSADGESRKNLVARISSDQNYLPAVVAVPIKTEENKPEDLTEKAISVAHAMLTENQSVPDDLSKALFNGTKPGNDHADASTRVISGGELGAGSLNEEALVHMPPVQIIKPDRTL